MIYPVHERFSTFQGEGVHIGRPAFFIRLFGCPVHCPWCDSAGTWHPEWIPKDIQRVSCERLVFDVVNSEFPCDFVVITGGEPAIHDLRPLVDMFHENAFEVHLETSGAFEIKGNFDWITVSPKQWKLPVDSSVLQAEEFKIIVEQPKDIGFYTEVIKMGYGEGGIRRSDNIPIWLHPEWSKRTDKVVLAAIADAVKTGGGLYRAGWQLHKLYNVDSRDPRSRPLVPLGGDLNKGL